MFNTSVTSKFNGQSISHNNSWFVWVLRTTVDPYFMISKERVSSNTPRLEICYMICNVKWCISFITIIFLSYIIWVFRLIKEYFSMITTPIKKISKCMFTCKSVTSNIITINDKTCVDKVLAIFNNSGCWMISSP